MSSSPDENLAWFRMIDMYEILDDSLKMADTEREKAAINLLKMMTNYTINLSYYEQSHELNEYLRNVADEFPESPEIPECKDPGRWDSFGDDNEPFQELVLLTGSEYSGLKEE